MYELATWINKHLEEISQASLFKKYFLNSTLDNVENVYFLSNESSGIGLTLTEELIVKSVHLFSSMFKDTLPFELKFTYDRKQIHKLLGEASTTGGGVDNIVLGYISSWDKYYYKKYSLHLQYTREEKAIELLTLGTLKFEKDSLPN